MMKISLILLAAGNSRRFGSNKLLYELEGKPMYRHIVDEIDHLSASVFEKKIVVSQYDAILDSLVLNGYEAIRNTESEMGISKSIQLGIEASAQSDAWCFLVADQPYLKSQTIRRFLEAFQKSKKTCGCVKHEEQTGNPCVFTNVYKKDLMGLRGDTGGKNIIRRNVDHCFFYEVEDFRELEDIDRVKKEMQ